MWWKEDSLPADTNQKTGELLICLGHQESPEATGELGVLGIQRCPQEWDMGP